MSEETTRLVKIDDRIDSYERFFNHAWCRKTYERIDSCKVLELLYHNLATVLKGLSNAFSVPRLAIDMTEQYVNAHQLNSLSNSLTLKVVLHICEKISGKVVLTPTQEREIREEACKLADEAVRKSAEKRVSFPRHEYWEKMVGGTDDEDERTPKNEYRLAIWSTTRVCYVNLFFAYEDFLCGCLEAKMGKRPGTGQSFKRNCQEVLGQKIAKECWINRDIDNARLVRNSLVHHGGKVTSDLVGRVSELDVSNGEIHILPADIKFLYGIIEAKVSTLIDWALQQPEIIEHEIT
ncbi:hypothetical protein [Rubinisphaera brasiliensis]|uniref:Uncharacterized protein n=1 Tax=Rubinisphaera brasiliensis (strain ATCC 49424 / DSM 5305 / JCM 21570 / IAM 15109 / NBRC 103401 / IFAM 1448) TaxID=756272 RepID=F0SJY0_RUBBR|nr:hypothetical protein [Rubinisphaera brasiliensis]ADY58669.1 hypothetical protein Plabr_1048 [Rubinisphaera brasiliensis DSM 5305]